MVISCTGLIKHRCSGQILLEMSLPLPGCSCQLFGATLPSVGYILLQYVNEFSGRSTWSCDFIFKHVNENKAVGESLLCGKQQIVFCHMGKAQLFYTRKEFLWV